MKRLNSNYTHNKTLLYFVQTFSSIAAIGLFMLVEMYLCVTVFERNEASPKSLATFDDGIYRPNEYNSDNALYQFGYKVNAIETGDIKQHIETRLKNEVKGAYFLMEPNGGSRLVRYIANVNGFNAVVHHRFGTQYSRDFSTSDFNADAPPHISQTQTQTNIVNDNRNNNANEMPSKYNLMHDRFLLQNRSSQQIGKFRQSFPKSITNQIPIRTLEGSNQVSQVLPSTTMTPAPPSPPPPTPSSSLPSQSSPKPVHGRRRQYEVFDPEVDIDIRRSISKPFFNLAKLKRPRKD